MPVATSGQPVTITPFTVAGAMSPATIASTLAQQNAEALGVMTIAQCIRAETPVIYGGFTSNVDMKSGAPLWHPLPHVERQRVEHGRRQGGL